MQEKSIVYLNGEFLAEDEAVVSVSSPGFLCGVGVFESMRAYKGKIVYLQEHLERILRACVIMGLVFPGKIDEMKRVVLRTAGLNEFKDAYLRFTLWKDAVGTGVCVAAKKYTPFTAQKYSQGFSLALSKFCQNAASPLSGIKTISRAAYELAFKQAKEKGYDEALILNQRGYVCEGTRSNIFIISEGCLFTPALSSGCLDGITRKVVFDLAKRIELEVNECNLTLAQVMAAQEVFLTNSLMGIMPVYSIDKRPIGSGRKCTGILQDKYFMLMKESLN